MVAGSLVGSAIVGRPTSRAQPAPGDVDRAKELYSNARKALDDGRYEDAVRDFGAAYDVTKDPVMFYWIASANDKAGRCDVALTYYGRYLKEAHPADDFLALVRDRIVACGGTLDTGSAVGSAAGSAVVEPHAGSGSAVATVGSDAGSAAPPPPLRGRHQGPWLMVGGSIAFVTIGIVLAYSANASENDISDLYVGLEGTPPAFDPRTKQRYDDLVAEGERYQNLSRLSFALAAGLGIGAAVWFYLDRDRKPAERKALVTPTIRDGGAGVTAIVRW